MSNFKNLLGFLVGALLLIILLWGLTELISYIFKIESSSTKSGIRWALIILVLFIGSFFRRKSSSVD